MKYLILLISILFASNVRAQEECYIKRNKEYENYKTAPKDSTLVTVRVMHEHMGALDGNPIYGATIIYNNNNKDREIIIDGKYTEYNNLDFAAGYTNEEGVFEIKLPYGEYIAEFIYIGIHFQFEHIILNTKTFDLGDLVLGDSRYTEFDEQKIQEFRMRDRKK